MQTTQSQDPNAPVRSQLSQGTSSPIGSMGLPGVADEDLEASPGLAEQLRSINVLGDLFKRRASTHSKLIVFRQLALLVETGIDVAEALRLAADTCRNQTLAECLDDVYSEICSGRSLSSAISDHEEVLGRHVTASIQAGEASGRLSGVLAQVADQLEQELEMRSTITGSLAYPSILMFAASMVASVLIWFVLPQFEKSFESMGVSPPAFTLFLINSSNLIRENSLIVLGCLIGICLLLIGLLSQPAVRRQVSNLCFYSPLLGVALRNLVVGRLFINLGHLLRNGISLLDAIQLTRQGVFTGAMQHLMKVWENDVIEGRGLTSSLNELDCLPDGADAMLVMAEKTGKLESVLTSAGTFYRDEGTSRLRLVLKLSEPIIIIGLGIFVGVVVASVLLPMLDVQSAGQTR